MSVSFADKLKAYMRDNHLSQRMFAEKAGVTQPAVYRWLKGSYPRARAYYRVLRLIGEEGLAI